MRSAFSVQPKRRFAALIALILSVSVPTKIAIAADPTPGKRSGTVAFVAEVEGQDEIHLLDLTSGAAKRLTVNPGPDRAPSWSLDGKWLAFNSRRAPHDIQPEIYVTRISDGFVRRVTRTSDEEQRASWERSGESLLFQRGNFAKGFQIWRAELKSRVKTELTKSDGKNSFDIAPDPSPTSDRVVLQTNRGVGGLFPFYLAVLQEGESKPYKFGPALPASVDGPRWSPDGRTIAFSAGGKLYVIDARSKQLTKITNAAASDISPDWSPDGRELIFQSDRRVKSGGLHIINLKTRKVSFIRPGRTPVWSATVHRCEYDRDGLCGSGSKNWSNSQQ
jgi:Tol biopolymer transport system component